MIEICVHGATGNLREECLGEYREDLGKNKYGTWPFFRR